MLKNIPKIISPKLMEAMMEMGHGDVLILADANYPAHANGKRIIRADGCEIPELLEAIMEYFPLDSFVSHPVILMKHLHTEPEPFIWKTYERIIKKADKENVFNEFDFMERLAFYKKSEEAYVIIQTGTTARYANIALQKGVI